MILLALVSMTQALAQQPATPQNPVPPQNPATPQNPKKDHVDGTPGAKKPVVRGSQVAELLVPPPFPAMPARSGAAFDTWLAGLKKAYDDAKVKIQAGPPLKELQGGLYNDMALFWSGDSLRDYLELPPTHNPDHSVGEANTAKLLKLLDRSYEFARSFGKNVPRPTIEKEERDAWNALKPSHQSLLEKLFALKPWIKDLSAAEKLQLYKVPEHYINLLLKVHNRIPADKFAAFIRSRDYDMLLSAMLSLPDKRSAFLADMKDILTKDLGIKPPFDLTMASTADLANLPALRLWVDAEHSHLAGREGRNEAFPPGARPALEFAKKALGDFWLERMEQEFADTGLEGLSYARLRELLGHLPPYFHEQMVRLWQVMKHNPEGKEKFKLFLLTLPLRVKDATCQCQTVFSQTDANVKAEMEKKFPFCSKYKSSRELPLSIAPECILRPLGEMADGYDRDFSTIIARGTTEDDPLDTPFMTGAGRDALKEAIVNRIVELAKAGKTDLLNDPWVKSQIESLARQRAKVAVLLDLPPDFSAGLDAGGEFAGRQKARFESLFKERLKRMLEDGEIQRELFSEAAARMSGELMDEVRKKKGLEAGAPLDADTIRELRGDKRLFEILKASAHKDIQNALKEWPNIKAAQDEDVREGRGTEGHFKDEKEYAEAVAMTLVLGDHDPKTRKPVAGDNDGASGATMRGATVKQFLQQNLQACVTAIERPAQADELECEARAAEDAAETLVRGNIFGDAGSMTFDICGKSMTLTVSQARKLAQDKWDLINARLRLPEVNFPLRSAKYHELMDRARVISRELEAKIRWADRLTADVEKRRSQAMLRANMLYSVEVDPKNPEKKEERGIIADLLKQKEDLKKRVAKDGKTVLSYYICRLHRRIYGYGAEAQAQPEEKEFCEDQKLDQKMRQDIAAGKVKPPKSLWDERRNLVGDFDGNDPKTMGGAYKELDGELEKIKAKLADDVLKEKEKLLTLQREIDSQTATERVAYTQNILTPQYQNWAKACLDALVKSGKKLPPGLSPTDAISMKQVEDALKLYSMRRSELEKLVQAAQAPLATRPDWSNPMLASRLGALKDDFTSGKNPFQLDAAQWEALLTGLKNKAFTQKQKDETERLGLIEKLGSLGARGVKWDGSSLDWSEATLWNVSPEKMKDFKETLLRMHKFGFYKASGVDPWLEMKRVLMTRFNCASSEGRFQMGGGVAAPGSNPDASCAQDPNYANQNTLVEFVNREGKTFGFADEGGRKVRKPDMGMHFAQMWDSQEDWKFLRFKNLEDQRKILLDRLTELDGARDFNDPDTKRFRALVQQGKDKLKGDDLEFYERMEARHKLLESAEEKRRKNENLTAEEEAAWEEAMKKSKPLGLMADFQDRKKKAFDFMNRVFMPEPTREGNQRRLNELLGVDENGNPLDPPGGVRDAGINYNKKVQEILEEAGDFMLDPNGGPMGNAAFVATQKHMQFEYLFQPDWKEFDFDMKNAAVQRREFWDEVAKTEGKFLVFSALTSGISHLLTGPTKVARWAAAAKQAERAQKLVKTMQYAREAYAGYRMGVRMSIAGKYVTEDIFGMPRQDYMAFRHQTHHMGLLFGALGPMNQLVAGGLRYLPMGTRTAAVVEGVMSGVNMAGVSFTLDMMDGKSAYHSGVNAARSFVFGVQWDRALLGGIFRAGAAGRWVRDSPFRAGATGVAVTYLANAGLNGLISAIDYNVNQEVRSGLREQGIMSTGHAALYGMQQSLVMDIFAATHAWKRDRTAALRLRLTDPKKPYSVTEAVAKYGKPAVDEAIGTMRMAELNNLTAKLKADYGNEIHLEGPDAGKAKPGADPTKYAEAKRLFDLLDHGAKMAGLAHGGELTAMFLYGLKDARSPALLRFLGKSRILKFLDNPDKAAQKETLAAYMPELRQAKRKALVDDYQKDYNDLAARWKARIDAEPDPVKKADLGRQRQAELQTFFDVRLTDPAFSYTEDGKTFYFHPEAIKDIPVAMIKTTGRGNAVQMQMLVQAARIHGIDASRAAELVLAHQEAKAVRGQKPTETVDDFFRRVDVTSSESAKSLLLSGDIHIEGAARAFDVGVLRTGLLSFTLGDIAQVKTTHPNGQYKDMLFRHLIAVSGIPQDKGNMKAFKQAVDTVMARPGMAGKPLGDPDVQLAVRAEYQKIP